MTQRQLYERPVNGNAPNSEAQAYSDSWLYHYHKILSQLEGTDEEKQSIIRKRILRYFGEFKLESDTYFSIRCDMDYNMPGIQLLPNKLVVYGIDYMTIERAKNYFQGFMTNIRRMDDSHFLIQFRSQIQCLGAINKYKKGLGIFINSQDMFESAGNGWIEMKPYHQFIFQRKLMARYCTNYDKIDNISVSTKKSCTFAYAEAKRRFMKSLKQVQDVRQCNRRDRKAFKNNNITDHNSNHHSKSRSRQKQFNQNQQRIFQEPLGDCLCRSRRNCNCKGNKNMRKHNYSRSRSRSSSMEYDRYSNQPKMVVEEEIKEKEFLFNLYIKRRDQKKSAKQNQSLDISALFSGDPFNKKSQQAGGKTDKSRSTANDDIELQIADFQSPIENALNPPFQPNRSELQFQRFLEKLKLDDSKNEHSAFDIED